ncbi:fumarylacetoacetate hydrolase family protein [Mycobacterium sp. 21AC1]|uniref:fumarylacetoacetate hydrolase family protein n=1 Tax=[Mycobacterium] appelbergii TaxID=2939269 RepID=UPI0029393033|nr:fumarylacetoacetate hydrolase family protein [Mycobacterium sp. 21AC1]MDV3123651.1 fumarylacetoacetate hydrolase family protein [Mycobacterium sp. 21AC1]
MTQYVIPPPPQASLPVSTGAGRFPIRRVFCVGRNYAAHAREMGKDPDREPPFFFMKPADAVVDAAGTIPYPSLTSAFHHEIELVVALSAGGGNVTPADALNLVWGYGVGVDLTRRDIQDEAKALSRPWDWAKGFDASAPCSPLYPVDAVGHPDQGEIWLSVNGVRKQQGDLRDLIWSVPEVISAISRAVDLAPGDLIFSGTPAGVGPMEPGDVVTGGVEGVAEFSFTVGRVHPTGQARSGDQ